LRSEAAARRGRRELAQVDWVGYDSYRRISHVELMKLSPLGLRDCDDARGASKWLVREHQIERFLRHSTSFDDRRRSIGSDDVGNAGGAKAVCGDHARKVPAGVKVRYIEVACMATKESVESNRQEELGAIGRPVRQIGKHTQRHAVARASRRPCLKTPRRSCE